MKTILFLCAVWGLALSSRLEAQAIYPYPPYPPPFAPFGYKFVPSDGDPQWGGEIWFSVSSETNGVTGVNYETDFDHGFINTPEGPFAYTFDSGFPWPVTPYLPQYPFPYSGNVKLHGSQSQVPESGVGGPYGITWNGSNITAMTLACGGQLEWVNTNESVSQFQDTNIFAVIEDYGFTLSSNSISLQLDFQSWNWQQFINDPSYSNTVSGQWIAIPPTQINVSAKAQPPGLSLTWNSVPGRTYHIFTSPSPSAGNWSCLIAVITATNDTTTWTGLPIWIPYCFFHVASP